MRADDSLRQVIPAASALPKLAECLVLGFAYERSNGRFVLVTDYPDRAAGSDRTFAALTFEGVSVFERSSGDAERYRAFTESYQADEGGPPLVIQDVQVSEDSRVRRVRLGFGPNFGGVGLEYRELTVRLRDARVRPQGNTFSYADLRSGARFAFARPFPDPP